MIMTTIMVIIVIIITVRFYIGDSLRFTSFLLVCFFIYLMIIITIVVIIICFSASRVICISIIHWTLTWGTGSLTYVCHLFARVYTRGTSVSSLIRRTLTSRDAPFPAFKTGHSRYELSHSVGPTSFRQVPRCFHVVYLFGQRVTCTGL